MIEVVTPENRLFYSDLIEDMYRMRYDVVIGKWGWDIPGASTGRDKDIFDRDDTIYILHLDETRSTVTGCCRLNQTTKPTMLSEFYADSCDLQPLPKREDIWEASRFIVSKDLPSRQKHWDVLWKIGIGVNEYGLTAGVKHIAWHARSEFYATIARVMDIEPLGRPTFNEEDQETYIPALSRVDEESLVAMRARLSRPYERITFALAPIFQVALPHQKDKEAA